MKVTAAEVRVRDVLHFAKRTVVATRTVDGQIVVFSTDKAGRQHQNRWSPTTPVHVDRRG